MPMSEVAGRMAIQIGASFLERVRGGAGVLLGGIPGVEPAQVVIVGGGTVGTQSAKVALGMGAHVTIIDNNVERLRYLEDILQGRFQTRMSNRYEIARAVRTADLLVGAVLIPGARTPRLVTEDMVATMKAGSVIIDVAVDQGGCIETIDRVTTHTEPTFVKHGVIHYAVPNIPGAVPRTSTFGLTNVTLPTYWNSRIKATGALRWRILPWHGASTSVWERSPTRPWRRPTASRTGPWSRCWPRRAEARTAGRSSEEKEKEPAVRRALASGGAGGGT